MKAEKSKDNGCTLSFYIGWRYCSFFYIKNLRNHNIWSFKNLAREQTEVFKNSSLYNSQKYQKQCCIDRSCDGPVLLTSL